MTANPTSGTTPALPDGKPSRRALLRSAAIASLTFAPAVAAASSQAASPIQVLFRQYFDALRRHHQLMHATPMGQWVPVSRVSPERRIMSEAREAMRAEPITSLEDMALKVMVITGFVSGEERELSRECMAFLERVQA